MHLRFTTFDLNRREYSILNGEREKRLIQYCSYYETSNQSRSTITLSSSTFRFEIDTRRRDVVDVGLAYDVCGVPIRDLDGELPLPADDVDVVVAAAATVVVVLAVPSEAANEQRPAPIGPPALLKAGSGGNAGKTTKTRSGRI